MKVTTPLEKRLYAALKRIAKNYAKPERIIRTAEKEWGSSPDEALSMAYENIQSEAAAAIKGVRVEKGSV